jgi:chromate reductase
LINLKGFETPHYDGDLEADNGLPKNAKLLEQLSLDQDGFFIASPEIKKGYTI